MKRVGLVIGLVVGLAGLVEAKSAKVVAEVYRLGQVESISPTLAYTPRRDGFYRAVVNASCLNGGQVQVHVAPGPSDLSASSPGFVRKGDGIFYGYTNPGTEACNIGVVIEDVADLRVPLPGADTTTTTTTTSTTTTTTSTTSTSTTTTTFPPQIVEVTISYLNWSLWYVRPASVTIHRGSTVRWRGGYEPGCTGTACGHAWVPWFDSCSLYDIPPGSFFDRQFPTEGLFPYFRCGGPGASEGAQGLVEVIP